MIKQKSNSKKMGYSLGVLLVLVVVLYFLFTEEKSEWAGPTEPPPQEGSGLIAPDNTWRAPTSLPKP